MTNPASDEMIERLQRGVTYREERWPGNDGSSRFPNISEANEIMKEAAIRIKHDAETIKRMDEALAFYESAWKFKTTKYGLEWSPKETLLDDCWNAARAARSSIRKEPS